MIAARPEQIVPISGGRIFCLQRISLATYVKPGRQSFYTEKCSSEARAKCTSQVLVHLVKRAVPRQSKGEKKLRREGGPSRWLLVSGREGWRIRIASALEDKVRIFGLARNPNVPCTEKKGGRDDSTQGTIENCLQGECENGLLLAKDKKTDFKKPEPIFHLLSERGKCSRKRKEESVRE